MGQFTLSPVLLLLLALVLAGSLPASTASWSHERRSSPNEAPIFPGQYPKFRIRPVDKRVAAGVKFVDFYCLPACQAQFRVEWRILSADGEMIVGDRHKVSRDGHRLRIYQPMEFYDKFRIVCLLHTPYRTAHASARLHVMSATKPRIVEKPRSGKFKKASRVVLQCAARGWPAPKIAWLFVSRHRHTGGGKQHRIKRFFEKDGEYKGFIKEPNRLIITRMDYHTAGTYICIAYNTRGYTKATTQIGFDRRSVHRPDMKKLVRRVRKLFKSFHAFGRVTNRRVRHKATCNMEISNQFRWTTKRTRLVDERTLTYDHVIWQLYKRRRGGELPGEILDVDEKLMKFLAKSLQCESRNTPATDCHRYQKFLSEYASYDGSCNNWKNPMWGAANTPLVRFMQAQYEGGLLHPQGALKDFRYGGHKKPSARLVSVKLLISDQLDLDNSVSQQLNNFGQVLDHDLGLTPNSATDRGVAYNTDCNKHCRTDYPCFPIPAPKDDPRLRGCLSFKRSAAFCSTGSHSDKGMLTPREQMNSMNSFLDASFVYGQNCDIAQRLREPNSPSGFLKTSPPPPGKKLRMLPIGLEGVPAACARHSENPDAPCYSAGDVRMNEFTHLIAMHTMFVREHNRIGHELHRMNPHWCPDLVHFEARKIVGALVQQIAFNEYLPLMLGDAGMRRFVGKYKGYRASVDPGLSNVFTSTVFRLPHAFIPDKMHVLNEAFKSAEKPMRLEQMLLNPGRVMKDGIDDFVRADCSLPLKAQQTGSMRCGHGVGDRLFEMTSKVAADLIALDIQRGRDHGIPSYNHWRVFCGLQWATQWRHLEVEITDKGVLRKLKDVYGSPENIDAIVGMFLEDRVDDGLLGPTGTCLTGLQFRNIRDGDRHWYENPGEFTPAQLQELRRYTFSRLTCNTIETVNEIQPQAFIIPRQKSDLVPCRKIPDMDLIKWKDPDRRHKKCIPPSPCSNAPPAGRQPEPEEKKKQQEAEAAVWYGEGGGKE